MSALLEALAANVPESPLYDPDRFAAIAANYRIIVPWSGGLDSTTAVDLAFEETQGENIVLFSTTSGQPWDAGERRARHFIKRDVFPMLQSLEHVEAVLPSATTTYGHVQVGRNIQIINAAANKLGPPLWGEVWLGWLHGETHIADSDKSLAVVDRLTRQTARIHLPLRHHTKADLVAHWIERGLVERAAQLYSCFVGGPTPCGRCQACFRFYVGFAWHDAEHHLSWLPKADFSKHITKYRDVMVNHPHRYTPRRIRQTLHACNRWEAQ